MQVEINFINPQEEDYLIDWIDRQLWSNELSRRVQHYGFQYDYKARRITNEMNLGKLPSELHQLAQKIKKSLQLEEDFDQAIINEYEPGQGISAHVDCVPCFSNCIVSLSLGSDCNMNFIALDGTKKQTIFLPRNCLLVLKDDYRYQWKHEIKAVKNDVINGIKIPRKRRISITFRTIILDK
jgi:alkylated DNA repair dioxygenase AlkB